MGAGSQVSNMFYEKDQLDVKRNELISQSSVENSDVASSSQLNTHPASDQTHSSASLIQINTTKSTN